MNARSPFLWPKDSRLSQAVVKATVTTGAKPHGQQQLARNLEVERAVIGQRCRPQCFGEVQRCYPLYFVPHTQYSCSWASLTDQLVRKFKGRFQY